jgi:hypothetical protein
MPFVNASSIAAGVATGDFIPVADMGGKLRVAQAVFTYAADAAGAHTIPIRLPRGARVLEVAFNTSVTTGSATVAIGIAGTVGKYRAAAAVTSADLWVTQGVATTGGALNANCGVPLATDEQLIMTTAAATLPASGRAVIRVTYVDNS